MPHWFALMKSGDMHDLGEHPNFEDADDAADHLGGAVWVVDAEGAREWAQVLAAANDEPSYQDTVGYLDTLPVDQALWWFMENVNDDHPHRSELFFYCRERVRRQQGRKS